MGANNGHIYQGQFIQPIKVKIQENQSIIGQPFDFEKVFGRINTTRAIKPTDVSQFNQQQQLNDKSRLIGYVIHNQYKKVFGDLTNQSQKNRSSQLFNSNITKINFDMKEEKNHFQNKKKQQKQVQNIIPGQQVKQQDKNKIKRQNKTQKQKRKHAERSKQFVCRQRQQKMKHSKAMKKEQTQNKISELQKEIEILKSLVHQRLLNKETKTKESKQNGLLKRNRSQLYFRKKNKIKCSETEIQESCEYKLYKSKNCNSIFSEMNSYSDQQSRKTFQEKLPVGLNNKLNSSTSYNQISSVVQHHQINLVQYSSVQSIKHQEKKAKQLFMQPLTKKSSLYFMTNNDFQQQNVVKQVKINQNSNNKQKV